MWKDPVVEETRKLREQYASRLNHDIDAIYEDVQRRKPCRLKNRCHFLRANHPRRECRLTRQDLTPAF